MGKLWPAGVKGLFWDSKTSGDGLCFEMEIHAANKYQIVDKRH
ncbi:hypothetical protein [Bacillus massiliglaciei]|nr:hypothetical protein [Bacillus massiliglaciei]